MVMKLMTYSLLRSLYHILLITCHKEMGHFLNFQIRTVRPREMKSLMQDDTESQKAVSQNKKPTTKKSFKNILLLDISERQRAA